MSQLRDLHAENWEHDAENFGDAPPVAPSEPRGAKPGCAVPEADQDFRVDAARAYVARDWWVLLVDPETKRPLPGYGPHTATQDVDRLAADLGRWPDAGLAVACAPSGLCVLDIDERHGGSVTALELAGDLPATWTVRTPGGIHLYLEHPGVETRGKLDEEKFPGVDVRDDAYVIAPPTRRRDGSEYELEHDDDPAPLGWLTDLVRAPERAAPHGNGQGDGPWERAHTWADILEPAGWTYVFSRNGQTFWRRPGKDDGWSAATNRTGTDTLKVFSTSTALPTEGTCSKFYVWAQLHHGCDLSTAGRAKAAWVNAHATDWVKERTPAGEAPTGAVLPDGFWGERDYLLHIRQAAHSRNRSATAVLHVVLARVSAFTPHTVQLPAIVGSAVPLCYFANLAGASGTGKSGANDIGTELIPAPERARDQLPVGSGQGLIEIFFETVEEEDSSGKVQRVKRQTYFNAYVYVDEGRVLADLGNSSNSILLPTLRSIWTGGTLGNTNASDERRRILPGGQYAYGVILAIQDRLAGPLLEDTASGTPQRFAWADASDPSIPDVAPDWPGGRLWTPPALADLADIERRGAYVRHQLEVAGPIVTEIQDADRARARGHLVPDELDAHAGLVQLKVAALLAILDRRAEVTTDDWELAVAIKADSDATRARVLASIAAEADEREAATSQRLARRQVAAADVAEAHRLTKNVDLARVLATKVWGQTDEWAKAELRRSMTSRDRGYFDGALEHAEAEAWVQVREEPGQGAAKTVIGRGAKRPT